jgi:hypothetical protein
MTNRQRHRLEEVLLCAFLGLTLGLWALAHLPKGANATTPTAASAR